MRARSHLCAQVVVATVLGVAAGCSSSDEGKGSKEAQGSGNGWSALAEGMDSSVAALAIGPDGQLYAGGSFGTAGGAEAKHVAEWNGTVWSAMPGKFEMPVFALAVYDDGSGPALHACSSEGGGGLRLSKWTGSAWKPLGDSINGNVKAMAVGDLGNGSVLHVGGDFQSIGGVAGVSPNYAQWNGKAWKTPPAGEVNGSVFALAVAKGQAGPTLYSGGWIKSIGRGERYSIAKAVAQYDGKAASGFGDGLDIQVNAVAMFDDGSGPALYAAGETMTGEKTQNLVKWDGKAWQGVGGGVAGPVHALAAMDGALYVGGSFSAVGEMEANNIARWDGKTWKALGEGTDDRVKALAVRAGKGGSVLFVAGQFMTAGGKDAQRIAAWKP